MAGPTRTPPTGVPIPTHPTQRMRIATPTNPLPAPQPQGPTSTPMAPPSSPRSATGTLPPSTSITGHHLAMTLPSMGAPAASSTGPFHAQQAAAVITVQYPQVGSTLTSPRGSYTVHSVLGSGEFGAVYECVGPFDQVYALKMIRPANRQYAEVRAEWAKEVERLLSLRHPNVVYIYDHFVAENLFYLALERCDHALSEMLGTPLQESLILEIARQLLAAVQFLHDNDVVHDDLHPGNVLISHTDRPAVKIADFGISQELRGASAIRPNLVHHTIMAPEILASGYTSKQSDLYQVGLLLYWMLTGSAAIPMNAPYQELVRQVSEGEPRRRAEAIGTPLGVLVAKMLRRREQYRYTSAREVWSDLRTLPAWQTRQLFPIK